MILWIFLGAVVLLLLYGVAVYNRLVRLRALVHEAFSGITVQLRRRADLVPNLVETVKGYAAHEKGVLEEVTRLRSQWGEAKTPEQKAGVASMLEGALGRLMVVVEPDRVAGIEPAARFEAQVVRQVEWFALHAQAEHEVELAAGPHSSAARNSRATTGSA